MEIRHIEYFLATAEHGGIAAAARALDLAQPTLAQTIRALERELGESLFDRNGRGLTLTAAGRALLGPGTRAMRNVSTWPNILMPDSGEIGGRLDIGVFPALGDAMVDIIADFCTRYPEVALRITNTLRDDHPRATDIVRNGAVDAVVLHLPSVDDTLAVLPIGNQEFVAVYPAGTALPAGPVDLADPPKVDMVLVPEAHSLTREVGRRMRSRGLKQRVTAVIEYREALIPFVASGLGGAIVDRRMAESAAHLVVVRPIQPPLERRFGLVYEKSRISPAAEAFLEVAAAHAADST